MATRSTPVGIKLICVLGFLGAGLNVLRGLAALSSGESNVVGLVGMLLLVLSLPQIIVYFGLWLLYPWAWAWAMGLHLVALVAAGYQVYTAGSGVAIAVGTGIVVAYLLFRRDLFRKDTGESSAAVGT